ncbi:MAG: nucleoside-diphosphate kinase [Clostridia bacterium]|nr:nucleoside-diphosphate kinase [Clostridia bacterium]
MKELSYVMVKPDYANNKELIHMVRNRILKSGKNFKIVVEGHINYTVDAARLHYSEHVEKPFYPELERYITSDKAYGMVVEGDGCIDFIHDASFMGKTKNPAEGTIRHTGLKMMGYLDRDPNINGTQNVAHSSDSVEAAEKEISIFIKLLEKELKKNDDLSL